MSVPNSYNGNKGNSSSNSSSLSVPKEGYTGFILG